nr:hypothetical protein [Tanacetum cinerariifolium]
MLNKENYVTWSSRLLRYAKSRQNGKLIHNSIKNGPYVRRMISEPGDPNREVLVNETFYVQTDDELTEKELKHIEDDDQAIQTILLSLSEDIYAAVDSCETAQEIWLRVQQMMKGSDIGIQEKKAKLFNEWERFTSTDEESIESYYHRFLKLMNDLKRNKNFQEKIASNLKFLNNLQLEWSRHVTIVYQTKELHTAYYTQLNDFLKYNQKEVDDLRAERLAKTQDPLALMATSNNPYTFPVLHQDQPSFTQNYMQQPMPNPEDITDPTTAMNMTLALMAKAFKLNYSTPTNNNQRISSNPRNRQIAQPGMNMGQDRQMQMVRGNGGNQFRQYAGQNVGNLNGYNAVQNVENQVVQNAVQNQKVQNVGNQNGLIVILGTADQNSNENGNLVAERAEGNVTGHNGNQIRCYNCRGLGNLARNCTFRPRRRDAAYLQTQLLISQKEEAGIQLQDKEFDLMATATDLDEIEKVNANCILMANLTFRVIHFSIHNDEWKSFQSQHQTALRLVTYEILNESSLCQLDINFGPIEADDQAIQTILLGLPEDFYAAVDRCETAQEIWLRVQQMMKGSDIGIQEKKAKLFNEWKRFTSNDGELIESYYHQWSRHVTIVHQTKDLHTADYTQLYDFLKYNQKEVDELKAERLAKTQNPLALMAAFNNPYNFPVSHLDQSSFNQNYMQQQIPNPKDITYPTTAMNMALALMAKAFKLNYSTPTNNNKRISSNLRNRQIAQPSMNMGQDRQMRMIGAQIPRVWNVRNQNGLIGVPGNVNQNPNRNGNLVAARAEGNAPGNNGNQIRCYNCRGVGHFARKRTVKPRRRDAAYLQTQLLIAQKEEAGIQLQAKEFDLMAAAADLDEIEEVNANCILMVNLQQASTSGTQTDKAPVYDSDGSAEVHNYENCDDNEIFNMFTQEEQYTELLEPIHEPHQVSQNDNNVIFEVTSVEQSGETVEQHPANVEEARALYDSLYQNLAIEVEKVN